jgi:hypothetical protein
MAIRATKRTALQTTETASSSYLLPDEDLDEFMRFSDAILQELAPVGVYQLHMATNLVQIEWDILRHRRLIAAVLRTEFRRMAAGVEEKGDPGHASVRFSMESNMQLGKLLLARDAKGDAILTKTGVLRSEIAAAALVSRRETVAYHEARIADLERRRRQMLLDLDRLKARKTPPEDLEDAVEVS